MAQKLTQDQINRLVEEIKKENTDWYEVQRILNEKPTG